MKKNMKKKWIAMLLTAALAAGMTGCAGEKEPEPGKSSEKTKNETAESKEDKVSEETEIQVFIAASLNTVMTELAEKYNEEHPEVKIIYNADSSGTLMTQIEEGYACDLFFSAAQKQMDQLENDGFLVDGTRTDVVNNQVVVVTLKDSGTAVTGLADLGEAESIALAGGSVPVGKYTRQAMVNLGMLPATEDVSEITTAEISEALGGVEISEQDNVSKVLTAVWRAPAKWEQRTIPIHMAMKKNWTFWKRYRMI